MEYRPTRISDIIRDINRDYYLPAIQREFVWDTERIEKLFDSIMGDYPIGSFLFWKVREENKNDWIVYEFIRDFDKDNPHNKEANLKGINKDISLVLDGQQRLTSIYIGLKGTYKYFYYRSRICKLYLNLLKTPEPNEENPEELIYQFKFRENNEPEENKTELWYEVGNILNFEDPEDAKKKIKKSIASLSEDLKDNANKLVGNLHAKIHTILTINYYEEKSQCYDKVLNIFVRANSAGKPLEYSDLLLSTATAKWENLDARKEINDFTDEINKIGTGYDFGKDFVLKGCLYLTENLPIQYKVTNFNKFNLIKIEQNWENIKYYISTTIKLISKYGFNSKNIIAPLTLLPITFFLLKKGNKNFHDSSEINETKIQIVIKKWLIISLLKNAFGSSTDTKLGNIRDAFINKGKYETFPSDILYKELNIEATLSKTEIENILAFKYQGKYTYLALSLLYPDKDWKDASYQEDHIFPKTEFQRRKLKTRGYNDKKIEFYLNNYNNLVNLELLTSSENQSKSSTPFDTWFNSRDENFRKRHLIPQLTDYSFDNFEEFIKSRTKMLIEVFEKI